MSVNMSDIERWLAEESDETEKTASTGRKMASQRDTEGELMAKIASEIEAEQFEKLASDAWMMGEIMGHAFVNTLEKIALEPVDDTRAGYVNESVQGEVPMKAQVLEDRKELESPMHAVVQKLLHARMGIGADASGEVQPAEDVSQFESPPGPQDGDSYPTSADTMEKKVAFRQKKAAAKNLLKSYLLSRR